MKLLPINSQSFKGLLIVPKSEFQDYKGNVISSSPKLEVETDDIIEIDNSYSDKTRIKYNNENNELCTHTYYHKDYVPKSFEKSRILLAYAAAAAKRDVIIKA